MNRLIGENVLRERDNHVRCHKDARDIDPAILFESNLTHAAERREEAASRRKSVDNPVDKRGHSRSGGRQ